MRRVYHSFIVGNIVIMREEPGPEGYDLFGLTEPDIARLTDDFKQILAKKERAPASQQ